VGKRHFVSKKYIPSEIWFNSDNQFHLSWLDVHANRHTFSPSSGDHESIRTDDETQEEIELIEQELEGTGLFKDVKQCMKPDAKYKSSLITFFRYNQDKITEQIVKLIAEGYHDIHAVHILFTQVECKKTHSIHCFLYLHLDTQIRLRTMWNWWGIGNQFRAINQNKRFAPRLIYNCICQDGQPLYSFPDPFFPPEVDKFGKNSLRSKQRAERILSLLDEIKPEMSKEEIVRIDPGIALHSTKILTEIQFERNVDMMKKYVGDPERRCLWL
jgi:hypothetical protein